MGKTGEASTHLGGALGLVGLVLMSGAAGGLALVSVTSGDSDQGVSPAQPAPNETSNGATGDGDVIVNPETIPPSQPGPVTQPATSRTEMSVTEPQQADLVIAVPARDVSVPPRLERAAAQIRRTPAPLEEVDFIVRFKGIPAIDRCLETYKSDPAAGQAVFAAWASDKPELSGVTLTGVTYSGEAILTYRGAADTVAPAARVGVIGRRIQALEGVRYADPDYTAQPGKGD